MVGSSILSSGTMHHAPLAHSGERHPVTVELVGSKPIRCASNEPIFAPLAEWKGNRLVSGRSSVRFRQGAPVSCARRAAIGHCSSHDRVRGNHVGAAGKYPALAKPYAIRRFVCTYPGGNPDLFMFNAGLKGIGIPFCLRNRSFSVQVRGRAPVLRQVVESADTPYSKFGDPRIMRVRVPPCRPVFSSGIT